MTQTAHILYQDHIETPLGEMISISDDKGLYLLEFTNRKNLKKQIARLEKTYTLTCLLYTSPSPRDQRGSRMPSSA